MSVQCARCGAVVKDPDRAECCWFCDGILCVSCWGEPGHCDHEEALVITRAMAAMTEDRRSEMIRVICGFESEREDAVN